MQTCYNFASGTEGLQPLGPFLAFGQVTSRPNRQVGFILVKNRSYDIRAVDFGDALIAEVAGILSEDIKLSLRQVVTQGSLTDFLQLPSASDSPELMSLGDLAATAGNEDAEQFIDQNALRKVLIGRYGIARSSLKNVENCKLALPIQVSYLRAPYTTQLTRPVISSGRHRLLATQTLLLAAGVPWSDINAAKVRVTTVVVADDRQFSQLMENNNTSRSQSQHELKVHSLSGKGIPTSDVETMLEFCYRATDATTQSEFFSQLVSLMSRGGSEPSFAFTVAKNSWAAVKTANRADKSYIKELFSEPDDLSRVAEAIATAIPKASKEAQDNPLVRNIATPVSRSIAKVLAATLKVEPPVFPTPEEEAQERLAKQKEQVAALEQLLTK